jgi:hypothetical protein
MRLSHPVSSGVNFGSALFIDYPGNPPTYGVNFPAIFAAAGAFPLTGGERASLTTTAISILGSIT